MDLLERFRFLYHVICEGKLIKEVFDKRQTFSFDVLNDVGVFAWLAEVDMEENWAALVLLQSHKRV